MGAHQRLCVLWRGHIQPGKCHGRWLLLLSFLTDIPSVECVLCTKDLLILTLSTFDFVLNVLEPWVLNLLYIPLVFFKSHFSRCLRCLNVFINFDDITLYLFAGGWPSTGARCSIHRDPDTIHRRLLWILRSIGLPQEENWSFHSQQGKTKVWPPDATLYLFKTIVHPLIEYCCFIWAGTSACHYLY